MRERADLPGFLLLDLLVCLFVVRWFVACGVYWGAGEHEGAPSFTGKSHTFYLGFVEGNER